WPNTLVPSRRARRSTSRALEATRGDKRRHAATPRRGHFNGKRCDGRTSHLNLQPRIRDQRAKKRCERLRAGDILRMRRGAPSRTDRDVTKVRTYDIVASSIINLRAGQRSSVDPEPIEATASAASLKYTARGTRPLTYLSTLRLFTRDPDSGINAPDSAARTCWESYLESQHGRTRPQGN